MHWYQGDESFGRAALNAAQEGLQSVGEFVPLDVGQPIDIFIYASGDDLRAAVGPGEDWVAGHADPARGVIMLAIEPGASQGILMDQRIPHELMHVMLYRNLGPGYRNLPAWLREGMAVLAENYPNSDQDRVLAEAAAANGLIPLKDLCASFPAGVGEAFLAYAQSRSFVNYLQAHHGSTGILNLARIYADGVDCATGPERAFGASLSSLELDWRRSVLGQNAFGTAFQNMLPYLFLLCLVLLVPLLGGLSMLRTKRK